MVYARVKLFSNGQVVRRIYNGSLSDNTWEPVGIGGEIIEISTPDIWDTGATPKNILQMEYVFDKIVDGGMMTGVQSIKVGYIIAPHIDYILENGVGFSAPILGLRTTDITYYQIT